MLKTKCLVKNCLAIFQQKVFKIGWGTATDGAFWVWPWMTNLDSDSSKVSISDLVKPVRFEYIWIKYLVVMMREPSNYDLIVPSRSSSDAADKHHNSASDKQLGENNVWHEEHHVMQINESHWSIWYLQKCWFLRIKYLLMKIYHFRDWKLSWSEISDKILSQSWDWRSVTLHIGIEG